MKAKKREDIGNTVETTIVTGRKTLSGNPIIKLLLLILLIGSLLLFVLGTCTAVCVYILNTRFTPETTVLHNLYEKIGYDDAYDVYNRMASYSSYRDIVLRGNFNYEIYNSKGELFARSNPNITIDPDDYRTLLYQAPSWYYSENAAFIYIAVCDNGYFDRYSIVTGFVDAVYYFGYTSIIFALVGAVLAVFINVLLCCMAGRYGKYGELKDNLFSKIWFEVPLLGLFCIGALFFGVLEEISSTALRIATFAVMGCASMALMALFVMNIAHRIKVGDFFKRTLVGIICIRVYKFLCFVFRSAFHLALKMPLMGKTALAAGILGAFALLICILGGFSRPSLIVAGFLSLVVVVAFMFISSYMLLKLQKGIDNLAAGNYSEKTDTTHLFPTFKAVADKINVASDGMNIAVEERMKSERMRTELITNVSHDIKTPLTSIINYSDLICSEKVDNERVNEYAGILHKQGERLKRLLEDLLEASKASTGNLEVVLGPCALNVLVTQIAAEYEEKFASNGLQLVTELPEKETTVLADGRRLSRVLDNLLNNACKYSLPGTRVYMSVKGDSDYGKIIIKNTSKAALNVSPDELMERFVRGDASRNTEGSGLGLSIAQSMTELQGGKLVLAIDGDLFKAIVSMKME